MGIGFEVMESVQKPFWVPVESTNTLCVGQIVTYGKPINTYTGGVVVMPAAAGVSDTTNLLIPFGVIVGTSDTADAEKYTALSTALITPKQITGVDTAAAQVARQNRMVEGYIAKGDQQAMVQVVRITSDTVLKGYFRNSATVGTTTIHTKTTDAATYTTSAITFAATMGFSPVANMATTYCVAGTNAGLYRIRTDTSATVSTYTRQWPVTPGAADTFKSVNMRPGTSRMQLDTTYGMWIDNTAALTSHYYTVQVYDIDLSQDAGNEWVTFSFMPCHFLAAAAARANT